MNSSLGAAYEGIFNLTGWFATFGGSIAGNFSVTLNGQTRGSGGTADVFSLIITPPILSSSSEQFAEMFGTDYIEVSFTSSGSDAPLYLLTDYASPANLTPQGCLQVSILLCSCLLQVRHQSRCCFCQGDAGTT